MAPQIKSVIKRLEKSLDTPYQDDKSLKPEDVPADTLAERNDDFMAISAR